MSIVLRTSYDNMTSDIKSILVCIDGSSNSNRAASYAAVVAKKFGAKATLLFVVAPSDHDMLAGKSTFLDDYKGFGEQRLRGHAVLVLTENVLQGLHPLQGFHGPLAHLIRDMKIGPQRRSRKEPGNHRVQA